MTEHQLAEGHAESARLQSRAEAAEAENRGFREEIAKIAACHRRELDARDKTAARLTAAAAAADAAAVAAAENARSAESRAAALEVCFPLYDNMSAGRHVPGARELGCRISTDCETSCSRVLDKRLILARVKRCAWDLQTESGWFLRWGMCMQASLTEAVGGRERSAAELTATLSALDATKRQLAAYQVLCHFFNPLRALHTSFLRATLDRPSCGCFCVRSVNLQFTS